MWICYGAGLPTLGAVLVSFGMPLVSNVGTKVACTWFGPRGRNIALMILLLSYFIPETIDEFLEADMT
jgi:hypothetical protein